MRRQISNGERDARMDVMESLTFQDVNGYPMQCSRCAGLEWCGGPDGEERAYCVEAEDTEEENLMFRAATADECGKFEQRPSVKRGREE